MTTKPTRRAVPVPIRKRLLEEFNHRCALCGGDRPQVHHIDLDPSNNDSTNLIPLCPSCHLTDQHNPTAPLDPDKLTLFRRHKDPLILGHQFEPLFRRMSVLRDSRQFESLEAIDAAVADLLSFVSALEMWSYYYPRLKELLDRQSIFEVGLGGVPEAEIRRMTSVAHAHYQRVLTERRLAVEDLVVELLRYQRWQSPDNRRAQK